MIYIKRFEKSSLWMGVDGHKGIMLDLDPNSSYGVWENGSWVQVSGSKYLVPLYDSFTNTMAIGNIPEDLQGRNVEIYLCGNACGAFIGESKDEFETTLKRVIKELKSAENIGHNTGGVL